MLKVETQNAFEVIFSIFCKSKYINDIRRSYIVSHLPKSKYSDQFNVHLSSVLSPKKNQHQDHSLRTALPDFATPTDQNQNVTQSLPSPLSTYPLMESLRNGDTMPSHSLNIPRPNGQRGAPHLDYFPGMNAPDNVDYRNLYGFNWSANNNSKSNGNGNGNGNGNKAMSSFHDPVVSAPSFVSVQSLLNPEHRLPPRDLNANSNVDSLMNLMNTFCSNNSSPNLENQSVSTKLLQTPSSSDDDESDDSNHHDFGEKTAVAVTQTQTQKAVDVSKWTADDIYKWILSIDEERFAKYTDLEETLKEEQLTGSDLSGITEQNLKDFGITKFADKKMIYNKIQSILSEKEKTKKGNEGRGISMEGKQGGDDGDDVPDQFLDPISYELMVDPVLCSKSGHTYDRKTIEDCIEQNGVDPITQQKIKKKHLVPNRTLKELIDEWKKAHPSKEHQ